ncbi:MAG: hypothetical protein Q4A19_07215 [Johnsonella sp.]|nr:hypothetical protein [Johnsonella sp.]
MKKLGKKISKEGRGNTIKGYCGCICSCRTFKQNPSNAAEPWIVIALIEPS